jgi:hypothetical protein
LLQVVQDLQIGGTDGRSRALFNRSRVQSKLWECVMEILGPLAFALLIGGQFLGAIVLISYRKAIYADPDEHVRTGAPIRPAGERIPEGTGSTA